MRTNFFKFSVLITAILVGQIAASGQALHLKARSGNTPRSIVREENRAARTGPAHQIVQFDHLPGVADLNALLAAGFKVIAAVPDNAVMVIGPTAATTEMAGVKWVGELETGDKLSPTLGTANPILAIVEFHTDVTAAIQESVVATEGLTFERPASLLANHIIVSASMDKLTALAAHDEVAYIFPADPALLTPPVAGTTPIQCAGMLTLSGPVAQYANVVTGWDMGPNHEAELGYVFGALTSKVPAATVEAEILRAMNTWSSVTNVVFNVGSGPNAARTVFLEFVNGAHGDAYPFDAAGTILAHTFYPVPLNSESIAGDMHLNAAVNWHVGGDVDIYTVVLHELGHAIGLTHTDNPGDVMYPYYQRGVPLSKNDIGAAQRLYGVLNSAAPVTLAPVTPAPVTVAPVNSTSPLSLTLNPIPAPAQASQIAIAGTVSGGVGTVTVQYQTDHGYSGKATVSAGTWNATGVTLVVGTNNITVTAFDSANHTVSHTETVTVTAPAASSATAPLSIRITSPSSTVTTENAATVSVGGTSVGGNGITQITWQTSTGASGTAVGTSQWLASNIPLLVGTNTIVVRTFDAAGASAWASVVVTHP
jgi:hypothetical protein